MVYTVIFTNKKLKPIYKLGFPSVFSRIYRLPGKTSSITAVSILVSILSYMTLVIGFQNAVANPLYDEPGISPYREQASQEGVDSIDPFMGQVKLRHLDLFLPGNGGLDIRVWRTYDSATVGAAGLPIGEGLGLGWMSHFGRLTNSCELASTSIRPVLELPDGTVQKFYLAPPSLGYTFVSKEGWVGNCIGIVAGGMMFISPEGLKYEMSFIEGGNGQNAEFRWLPKKITDKHGNWLSFGYGLNSGGSSPLWYTTSVTANDGRLVTLEYEPAGIGGRRKLKKISSNGQSWLYEYVAFDGFAAYVSQSYSLKQVTRPDGLTWAYEYPQVPGYNVLLPLSGYLGKFTRPYGAVTSYTYGYPYADNLNAVRLTQKSVLGPFGSASSYIWKYRYRFRDLVDGVYVTLTDIVDPFNTATTYKHANSGVEGQAWQFGLLVDKLECSYSLVSLPACTPSTAKNREQFEWGYQENSGDTYVVFNGIDYVLDYKIYRPLLTKKTITREGTAYTAQYLSHDSYGNPAKVIETGNGATRTTDLTYYNDPVKWIVGQPDKETIDGIWVTDRNFDTNGNVLSVLKNGILTSFTYYPSGDIASVTNAKGDRTDFKDYFRGTPRREDQPGGVTVFRVVNDSGTTASEINGEGRQTQYTYDGLNQLTGIVPPAGNPTTITRFSSWSTVYGPGYAQKVTRGNFEETTILDGFGRALEINKLDKTSLAKIRLAYQYDALGRKILESYPTTSANAITSLPRIEYTYDNLGRITQVKHADGKIRQLQYLAGNQTKVINENGKATTYTYRSFGDPDERQLMSVAAPVAAANMTITRNALGKITSMTQAGVTRSMQYDTRAYLIQTYHPEIGWTTYSRDAVGNPLSKSVGVAPNARTINYSYDTRNRLSAAAYQDATTPPVTLTYNRVDDVISATRGAVTRTYAYDANRNLVGESLAMDGRTFGLNYLYDGNDVPSQVTYPNGQIVNFYPDALGRPTAVSPYVTGVTYHPSGQVSSMSYANGVTTTQALNTRQWPSQLSVTTPTTGLINTAYGYDGLGNVTSMTDSVDAGYNRTLGYDDIDRLVSATGPWGAGSIAYDGRGNILSQNYGATYAKNYTYDTANRLASYTGSTAFTYDAWGNATRSGTALSYHLYDDASNLYCASCDTPSPLQFEYDANNYRVKKTRNGSVTYSLYAKDGNLMMEYTPSTGDLKQFAYHNKKQVAMRQIVDPALNLGQNGLLIQGRFATAIPRKPLIIEPGFLIGVFSPPLLSAALLATTN